jgi:hypothetical protein
MDKYLPDVRLDERLVRLVGLFSAGVDKSIPQACGSAHEIKAVSS